MERKPDITVSDRVNEYHVYNMVFNAPDRTIKSYHLPMMRKGVGHIAETFCAKFTPEKIEIWIFREGEREIVNAENEHRYFN